MEQRILCGIHTNLHCLLVLVHREVGDMSSNFSITGIKAHLTSLISPKDLSLPDGLAFAPSAILSASAQTHTPHRPYKQSTTGYKDNQQKAGRLLEK